MRKTPPKHQPGRRHHLRHRRMFNNNLRQQATRRYKMLKTLKRLSLESDFHETQLKWLEANAYFQLHQSTLPNLTNLNEFTIGFQTMIYNYFASNFGTINNKIKPDGCTKKSIKLLKKKLKQPKFLGRNNHHFDNQIRSDSKTLRSKFSSSKSSDSTKQHNTTSQLKRRFWWFCKKVFNSTTSLSPSYSVTVCKNYFHSLQSDTHNNKQQQPNWILKLSTPPTPCNKDFLSYNEISKIIRK
ncbi:hypothetical protein HELRODRAFT_179040 [Helobdella robusta]|uniref:Uncharacterized protein n=1 Tax=Helobdella robusta TaxID=6412 RepID=T1FE31_HELRO|nr:hypothetical protein HELRODRAFT_179040 [Helobdella robusta]ESN95846.1 hypothetical protein HELRODRAFT_179040 [Helobdella robusta]